MLTIYRASAGAGKTHQLTGEYLKLLFAAPGAFRRVLAVTFTNKATDEMKHRIIEELYKLASGKPSDYISYLLKNYPQTEESLRKRSASILIELLHDYSAFNISTIDRFFQQTVRAFVREIGLQGGYGIEMDENLVLSTAVDNLLSDLEKPENRALLGWLLRFAEDKIDEKGDWNLRRDILTLGKEVFKENYKVFREAVDKDIADKQALSDYRKQLLSIINKVESDLRSLSERALSIMDQHAVSPTDFKGGSRSVLNAFNTWARGEFKEPTATFRALPAQVSNYYTKTTPIGMRQIIEATVADGLGECVERAIRLFDQIVPYYTAKEILKYYYTLGILTDISHQIAFYREEKNVMLIADTTELLHKVIDGSNAPFIYEKTGTHIDHYMIDEFQDTSNMQWQNFRPLIEESLAQGKDNLIVGDVKQSIYRFRNSDWNLLDEQVQEDFAGYQLQEETLQENWRSAGPIVDFNNALFSVLPCVLQQVYNEGLEQSSLTVEQQDGYSTKIMSAYRRNYQQKPAPLLQKEGYVHVEFLQPEEDGDWKDAALQRLPVEIERLQEQGYALKDIAVLVRTKKEGAKVVNTLLTYKEAHPESSYQYDVISDEALYISSSVAVRFLVSLLRYLQHPENQTAETVARISYQVLKGTFGQEETTFSPEVMKAMATCARQSLYEILESLFRLFEKDFPQKEQVFVQSFLDLVAEFAQKESSDISRFLKWWDETGSRKTISSSDDQNAVRVLTIHKSKGLGFPVVLIPFGDWSIDHAHNPGKPVIVWCHPMHKPFDQLHLVPVRYGKNLPNTYFAEDYYKERLHAFIDNLNALYVACTRAKEQLIIFAPRPKNVHAETGTVKKVDSLADALWVSLLSSDATAQHEDEPLISLSEKFEKETATLSLGNRYFIKEKQVACGGETGEIPMTLLHSVSSNDRLHLRLHSQGYFFDNQQRKYGSLMHELLSAIRTTADVTKVVARYRIEGIIGVTEEQELVTRLQKLLAMPEVAVWYDGSAQVLNEVDILFGKGQSKRPDRVMICGDKVVVVDYKFGEHLNKRYQRQVKEYMQLIRQMGYEQVEGYLWYVELAQIEPISI